VSRHEFVRKRRPIDASQSFFILANQYIAISLGSSSQSGGNQTQTEALEQRMLLQSFRVEGPR